MPEVHPSDSTKTSSIPKAPSLTTRMVLSGLPICASQLGVNFPTGSLGTNPSLGG